MTGIRFIKPEELKKNYIAYPNTVAVVSAFDREHRPNFMSVVWQSQLSMDPLLHGVSISPKRYTHSLIMDSKRFSVAFYAFEALDIYVLGGRLSGRDYDKVATAGLDVNQGRVLDVPLLNGFYAALECDLDRIVTTGDHDLFIGRVRGIHLDQQVFAQDGITPLGARPTLYLGANRFVTIDRSTLHAKTLEDLKITV